jgi:hypothetical protein
MREPQRRSTRLLTFAVGALGSLIVVMAMVALTPWNVQAPSSETASGVPQDSLLARFAEELAPEILHPIVVPIAQSGMAVALSTAVEAWLGESGAAGGTNNRSGELVAVIVRLPDGAITEGMILDPGSETRLAVIRIRQASAGIEIAPTPPDRNDLVTVLATEPITVTFDRLGSLTSLPRHDPGGFMVIDEDGRLVGLCRHDGDRISFVPVDADVAIRFQD